MDRLRRVEELLDSLNTMDICRKKNYKKLYNLFEELDFKNKIKDFEELFSFLAINLTGLSLQRGQLGKVLEGRYIQIIGIRRVDGRMKNISLKYFGKAENVDEEDRRRIIEFVLRWRLEKSFINVDYYMDEVCDFYNISSNITK